MSGDGTERLAAARDFIWRNGRLLDRQLFACLFDGGPREAVLAALRAYQNEDGGFGNALEPDMRCPDSQPVSTEMALHVLDRVDGFGDPLVARVCAFLERLSTTEGGLPTALPSVVNYPCAPWWPELARAQHSLNPTAAIAGLLFGHGVEHSWLQRAAGYCWQAIATTESTEFHDLMPALTFLEHAPDRARADQELDRMGRRIIEAGVVAFDTDAPGYVKQPLDWAPTPSSFCRGLFSDEAIEIHLLALAARQQPDGGWPINWEPLSPACELEWRSWQTIEALSTLRAYGALDT